MMLQIDIHRWFAMVAILNPKWPPNTKILPLGRNLVSKQIMMLRIDIHCWSSNYQWSPISIEIDI
jgi:hypothetical protein